MVHNILYTSESGFDSITSGTASLQSLETVISEKCAQQSNTYRTIVTNS